MTFERLMVPTDFSECAGWALEHAIAIARETDTRIDIVHSMHIPNLREIAAPPTVERAIRDAALQRLAMIAERVAARNVEVDTHLIDETPSIGIQKLAEEQRTGCIVMGTRGLSGLQHVLLGSTAERTLRIAPCPVLTVGHAPRPDAGLPGRVLVPTDFSETAEHAIAWVRRLLENRTDAEVVLLHVFAEPIAAGPYAFASKNGFLELQGRISDSLEGIADGFRAERIAVVVRIEQARSAPAEIARVAATEQCDWIVLGTHGRTGLSHLALGSIAERVVRAAVCPTLTVKRDD